MTWKIEYRESDRIVHIKTIGDHTLADVDRMTVEVVAEGKKRGVDRYLVDDREMVPKFRTLQIYDLPQRLLDLGLTSQSRLAVVISGTSSMKADWEFFRDRLVTFGKIDLRIFVDSVEDALDWLRGNP